MERPTPARLGRAMLLLAAALILVGVFGQCLADGAASSPETSRSVSIQVLESEDDELEIEDSEVPLGLNGMAKTQAPCVLHLILFGVAGVLLILFSIRLLLDRKEILRLEREQNGGKAA